MSSDGDSFQRVQTGDRLRIPAAAWNDLLAMLGWWKGADLLSGAGPLTRGRRIRPGSTVLVQNNSGADRDRWAVLQISNPVILPSENEDEFQNRFALIGISPTGANPFVILQEPVASGSIGRAVLDGVTACRVNAGATAGQFGSPTSGETGFLTGASSGLARLLWVQSPGDVDGTGKPWALARLGDPGAAAAAVFSGALVSASSTQNISSGSFTDVTWGSTGYDTDSYVYTSVLFQIPADGYYAGIVYFVFNTPGATLGTGLRSVTVARNTATIVQNSQAVTATNQATWVVIPFEGKFFATDTVSVAVYQDSGSTMTCEGRRFAIHRIGVV